MYRQGINIANLQRSERWIHTKKSTMEHYLKPGLFSMDPAMIKKKLPQYLKKFSLKRMLFLRSQITAILHTHCPFNIVARQNNLGIITKKRYPTADGASKLTRWITMAHSMAYIKNIEELAVDRVEKELEQEKHAKVFREDVKEMCYKLRSGKKLQFYFNHPQRQQDLQHAKIASLTNQIEKQGDLARKLQEQKSENSILKAKLEKFYDELNEQGAELEHHRKSLHDMQKNLDTVSAERDMLLSTLGTASTTSVEKCNKSTRTQMKNELVGDYGKLMLPSNGLLMAIVEKEEEETKTKFVDENGESRLTKQASLRNNVKIFTRKCLSRRNRTKRAYNQSGKGRKEWIAVPATVRYTRSMRIQVHFYLYECVHNGPSALPEMVEDLDPEEILEKYEKLGHSDNPKCYSHLNPKS